MILHRLPVDDFIRIVVAERQRPIGAGSSVGDRADAREVLFWGGLLSHEGKDNGVTRLRMRCHDQPAADGPKLRIECLTVGGRTGQP